MTFDVTVKWKLYKILDRYIPFLLQSKILAYKNEHNYDESKI